MTAKKQKSESLSHADLQLVLQGLEALMRQLDNSKVSIEGEAREGRGADHSLVLALIGREKEAAEALRERIGGAQRVVVHEPSGGRPSGPTLLDS